MAAMSTPNPLHIFKPGRQTAMSGVTLEFSESDLAASARAYNPAKHEAPIVIGHPRHDAPAYGWVKSLTAGADGLSAEPHQVDTAFAELVAAGRYKKISASFYLPGASNNPVPGVYYLRHVGFLGAQPPAVKGLKQAEFADAEDGIVEFGDWDDRTNAGLWRSLRDWIIAKFGLEEADKVLPVWDVQSLANSAAQPEPRDDPRPAFSEPNPLQEPHVTPEQAAAIEAENAALKKQLAEAQAEKQSAGRAAVHANNVAFAEQLTTEGRLLPKHQAVVIATLDAATPPDAPLEFGEGTSKRPLADGLRELFQQLPQVVEFGELATSGRAGSAPSSADVADFAEKSTDPDRLNLHARAMRLAQDKNIPYEQAARLLAGR